jgi:molybdopterin adenylyltransferase
MKLDGIRTAVVTVSDRCFRGERIDLSGPAVAALLASEGAVVTQRVIADERDALEALLRSVAAEHTLVLTTGGTGLAPRDITPEATLAVCDRQVPGLAEQMRAAGLTETPYAALGRGVCGTLGATLLLNLPGSPTGARSSLQVVLPLLPHALALLAGEDAPHQPAPGPLPAARLPAANSLQ